jgi:hypothetical protein
VPPPIAHELDSLAKMSPSALRQRYTELFGEEPPTLNQAWLAKRIAWRLQVQAEGDLSERARKRALELANDADLRLLPPRSLAKRERPDEITQRDQRLPAVGQVLVRRYKGQAIEVRILADGFEYAGAVYPSLSAVAKAVTGSHWNGYRFFGLGQP